MLLLQFYYIPFPNSDYKIIKQKGKNSNNHVTKSKDSVGPRVREEERENLHNWGGES